MNTKTLKSALCLLLLILSMKASSQDKPLPVVKNVIPSTGNFGYRGSKNNEVSQYSQKVNELTARMMEHKRSGNKDGVIEIQKQLDVINGSVTEIPEQMNLTLVADQNAPVPDNINANFVSEATGVKGIATCTEQVGSTAGRIWAAFVYGFTSGSTPDNLRICYKDFAGTSWNQYVTLGFSAGNRMQFDQIDAEIIEDYTGDKFLWVTFGYFTSSNQWRIGVTVIRITGGLNYGGYTLSWPGTTNSTYYHKPRIVSDNEGYRSNPWIYISACLDSAVAGGYYAGEKTAICYSPYTVLPTFTYKPNGFIGYLFAYPSNFYCDIAYFRNGGQDSILLVESSLEDSSRIVLAKTSISNFVSSSYASYAGNISTINNRRAYQAYIASNGAYPNLMIVNLRKYNDNDWDIEYYSSLSGSRPWSNGFVDYRGNFSTRADITGYRSAPGFYACAYSEYSLSYVPVVYSFATNSTWQGIFTPLNHTDCNPYNAMPRPGIQYGPELESCFALWTEYSSGSNVWASTGCIGPVRVQRNIYFRGVPEAMWDAPADTLRNDSMTLYLRNDFFPYAIVDSAKTKLDNDGYGNFLFYNTQHSTYYYLVAKHRNSLETWSSATMAFSTISTSGIYDFTTADYMSYGSNTVHVDVAPDLYAFYSGDINNDGLINLTDLIKVSNDASSFTAGYQISDLNGDQTVSLNDLIFAYNNSSKFVSLIRP